MNEIVRISLATFCLSFLSSLALVQLTFRPFVHAHNRHWTERARLLYPVGQALRMILAAHLAFVILVVAADQLFLSPTLNFTAIVGYLALTYAGVALTRFFIGRRIYPALKSFGVWLRELVVALLPRLTFLALFFGLLALAEEAIELRWPYRLFGAWALVYALYLAGGWIAPMRWLGLLAAPSGRIRSIVARTAAQIGMPRQPVVVVTKSVLPYAAAAPTSGTLVYSLGVLDLLDDQELAAITAHEMTHLQETRTQIAARYLPAIASIGIFIFLIDHFHDELFTGLVLGIASLFAFGIGSRDLSRRLERQADKGAKAQEADEGTYARALEKLYREMLVPATIPRRQQTHPDLYDRMVAVGATPDYSRPSLPPKRQFVLTAVAEAVFLSSVLTWIVLMEQPRWWVYREYFLSRVLSLFY